MMRLQLVESFFFLDKSLIYKQNAFFRNEVLVRYLKILVNKQLWLKISSS